MADSMEAESFEDGEKQSGAIEDNCLEDPFRNNSEPLDESGFGREGEENDQDSANTELDLLEQEQQLQPKKKGIHNRAKSKHK